MADSAALASSAYGNAVERNDAQKKALLDAIAQQGTAGRQAYEKSGQAIQADRQAAIQATLGTGAGGQNLLAGQSQEDLGFLGGGRNDALAVLAGSNRSAAAAFQADRSAQASGVNEFYGRMNAAVPIEQSRTQGAIEQIIQDMKDKEAERAFQQQMQQLQLEEARTQLSAAKASASNRGGGGSLSVSDQLKIMDRDRQNAQTTFVSDFNQSWGPKTSNALNLLLENKDQQSAFNNLSQMAADSANFTKPIYARDKSGHLIFDSQHHAKVLYDFSHVNPTLLRLAISSYYQGGRAPTRDDWAAMNGGDPNVRITDAR